MHEVRVVDVGDPTDLVLLRRFVADAEQMHGHPLLSDSIRLVLADASHGDEIRAVVAEDDAHIAGCAIACHSNGSFVLEVVAPHDHDVAPAEDLVAQLIQVATAAIGSVEVPLVWWCRGHEPWADAVATSLGLVEDRHLLQMRMQLTNEVVDTLRELAVETRPFRVGVDDAAWLALNNRAFSEHGEQGNWSSDDLRRRLLAPWFDANGFRIFDPGGGMQGFCWTKVHPGDSHDPPLGEIYVIAVEPTMSGRGLGRSLTASGLVHLADAGLTVGMLYVDAANVAAVALYQSLGMVVHHVDRAFLVPSPALRSESC